MEIVTIVLLIVLGVILLLVEFMLVPGVTVAGIGSVISFGISIFLAFRDFGKLAGYLVLLGIVIFVPVFLYFIFKGRAAKPIMLETNIEGTIKNVDEQKVKVGDEGLTIGRLAPMGKAKINGIAYEVKSLGFFVDQHTPVKVIKVDRNTIIVEPLK